MGVEDKLLSSSDHTHINNGSLPSLPHIKEAVSLTSSLWKRRFILQCVQPAPPLHCCLYLEGAHLFPLCPCTLSYYIPEKAAFITMYQQKSSHFSKQLSCVKSVFCKSVSITIPCSHQNPQSYGTMMRNLPYAGKTTKATFFLLLTTSCLPKHNWKSSISLRNRE